MDTPSIVSKEQASVMELWRELCHIFRRIHFLRVKKVDISLTTKVYRTLGNDHVTLNLMSPEWKESLCLLSECDDRELNFLKQVSEINLTHLSAHTTRKASLYFVAYPAFLSFLLNRVPKLLPGAEAYSLPLTGGFVLMVAIGALMFLKFYTNKWQSMELDTCIAFAIAGRKLQKRERKKTGEGVNSRE